jgi:hypothetical protein
MYKELSIISGTDAADWSKLTLRLLATITLEVVPFRAYAPFPALCHFLNAFWNPCCMRVFSTACDSSCQNGDLSVLSSIGKTEKSRVDGE